MRASNRVGWFVSKSIDSHVNYWSHNQRFSPTLCCCNRNSVQPFVKKGAYINSLNVFLQSTSAAYARACSMNQERRECSERQTRNSEIFCDMHTQPASQSTMCMFCRPLLKSDNVNTTGLESIGERRIAIPQWWWSPMQKQTADLKMTLDYYEH